MGQGDLPTPRGGGPLRRRREKRQLEQLVQASRERTALTPSPAHVRVVEDQATVVVEGHVDGVGCDLETSEQGSVPDAAPPHLGGSRLHVRPVPIDEPISNSIDEPITNSIDEPIDAPISE